MVEITIIIPVYNAEKTIHYCLDSILKQTFQNFEVICVDDGSTDKSACLIENYKIKDNRVILVKQKNSGAATARNVGLEMAKGKYLTFVDSDDFIENDFLRNLYNNKKDADIVVSGYTRVKSTFEAIYTKIPKKSLWSVFKFSATWGKLYLTEVIRQNNITFEDFRLGEDLVFLSKILTFSKKVKIIQNIEYNYMFNENSITNTISKVQKINHASELLRRIMEIFKNEDEEFSKYVYYFLIKTSVYNIYSQRKNMNTNEKNEEFENNINVINSNYKFRFTWQKDEEFLVNILVNLFILAKKAHFQKLLFTVLK